MIGMYRAIAVMICASMAGCDLDKRLEGCGSAADALAAQGLVSSAGAEFDLAGLELPLPEGYLYRIRNDRLELFKSPGVYCDSGDWGLVQSGFLQLQVHSGGAPEDAFLHFPNTHRGYVREQVDYAPVSPLDYSFGQNAMNWHVRAYFAGVLYPRLRFMYLRTQVSIDGEQIGLSIHYFPDDTGAALSEITAAIDTVVREGARE